MTLQKATHQGSHPGQGDTKAISLLFVVICLTFGSFFRILIKVI